MLKFRKKSIFGSTVYQEESGKFTIIQNSKDLKYYIQISDNDSTIMFTPNCAGFSNVKGAIDFLNSYNQDIDNELIDLLNMYGFHYDEKFNQYNLYLSKNVELQLYILDGLISISTPSEVCEFNDVESAIIYIDNLLNLYDADIFSAVTITSTSERKQVVQAAISSREITDKLVRVKSSNVWAYAINIKDSKAKVGDVVAQFKGPKGGPGDVYMYFDVPITVWKKWITSVSKGHYFWVNIRNKYLYRKLTGDRKGKLKNAIN